MYLRLVRQEMPVHNVAIGFTAGMFVGFLPIIPFQTIVAVAVAFPVRGSKIAAALGTWISNPINIVIPFYLMLYYAGRLIIPGRCPFNPELLELAIMLEQGWFLVMLVGGVALGIPASILSYFLTRRAIAGYRRRKQEWRKKRRTKSLKKQPDFTGGTRLKRSLGQNFLKNEHTARRIVEALAIQPGDYVLEIGPGAGALTRHICAGPKPADLLLLEKDAHWAFTHAESCMAAQVNCLPLNIDALTFAWERLDFSDKIWKIAEQSALQYSLAPTLGLGRPQPQI